MSKCEQARQHVWTMQLIAAQLRGPLSVCVCGLVLMQRHGEGGAGKLIPITKPTPKAIAHGKSYVFTEVTPDPTCLDSYTTTKRLQEKKKTG